MIVGKIQNQSTFFKVTQNTENRAIEMHPYGSFLKGETSSSWNQSSGKQREKCLPGTASALTQRTIWFNQRSKLHCVASEV